MPGKFETLRIKRLKRAVEEDRRQLKDPLAHRKAIIDQIEGSHHGSKKGPAVPINMLGMFVGVYQRLLAPNAPKTLVTTLFRELRSLAADLTVALNMVLDTIDYGRTLNMVVFDALVGFSVTKTGRGDFYNPDQPFADRIDPDDWVMDMTAREQRAWAYAGHRYELPLDFVRNSDMFNPAMRDEIHPMQMPRPDASGEDRVSGGHDEQYEKRVELWDLWIPRDNVIVTLLSGDDGLPTGDAALREVEYDGPDGGPFDMLGYFDLPGSSLPLAGVAHIQDLHGHGNDLWLKLQDQSARQKSIGVTGRRGANDARLVTEAKDGVMLALDDPNATKELSYGGIDQSNFAMFLKTYDLFNLMSGNLEVLGGLSTGADTLGQEELLAGAAGKRPADMAERTILHSKKVVEKLAWYLLTDPQLDMQFDKQVTGTRLKIPVQLRAQDLQDNQADYARFNFGIDVYSMQHSTPAMRLQKLLQTWERVIAPVIPLLQQQGDQVDVRAFLEEVAKLSDQPIIRDIVRFANAPAVATASEQPVSEKPSLVVKRSETTRRNVSGTSRAGNDNEMLNMLSGGQSEAAGLFRQAG